MLSRVVERPQFPMRICYVNFAEHLQNAFNPNVLFDVPVNRWTLQDWHRFIDMISAFRYNIFEFWLVPTLFSPRGPARRQDSHAVRRDDESRDCLCQAARRGRASDPGGEHRRQNWHSLCPHDPKERAELFALWDYWSRALRGNECIGIFPGDPGGCCRNGCTAGDLRRPVPGTEQGGAEEQPRRQDRGRHLGRAVWRLGRSVVDRQPSAGRIVDALLPCQAARVSRRHVHQHQSGLQSRLRPQQVMAAMAGRSPRQAAKICPVLTWDYSVTEGEGTVSPRCRVRRMFQQRKAELALGCYSGGICYTMAPEAQLPEHLLLRRGVVESRAKARRRARAISAGSSLATSWPTLGRSWKNSRSFPIGATIRPSPTRRNVCRRAWPGSGRSCRESRRRQHRVFPWRPRWPSTARVCCSMPTSFKSWHPIAVDLEEARDIAKTFRQDSGRPARTAFAR